MSTPQPKKVREQHAELIRRAVLDAARRLFAERGYAQTPIRLLAEEAGVAVQTIYSTFGSKSGVLIALFDLAEQGVGMEEFREQMAAAVGPRELSAVIARIHRRLFEMYGDVALMLRDGAASDPEVATAAAEFRSRRQRGLQNTCDRLGKMGALKERDREAVAAHVEALVLPETFELAKARGWSPDRYEGWLRESLQTVLLRS